MKDNCLLYDGEKIDDLVINGYKIIQSAKGFKFSLDAILLSHFATLKRNACVVDLGTGTGVMALLAYARGAGTVLGIEIDSYMADMAARSMQLNGLEDKIEIINHDFRQLKGSMAAGSFDLVLANPPYRPLGHGKLNDNENLTRARHETTATLEDVINAARYLLKFRGRFALIHRAERISDIICTMVVKGIEPKKMQFVQPFTGVKPKLVLIEGVRGAASGLEVLAPLIVYHHDGTYTDEILKFYNTGETNE